MRSELPVVGVLMAVYHGDDLSFLERAVTSLLAQAYPLEKVRIYLCVDGQLPLAHQRWLKRNEALFFRVLWKTENRGLALALNDLLASVEDEAYLFRMDADDESLPNRFAAQVQFMESNPNVDLLGSNAVDMDEHGKLLGARSYPERHEVIMSLLPRMNPILHPTYCIRARTVRRDHLRYPNAFLTEDWAFLFEAARCGWRLHNLQTALLKWRTSETFIQRRSSFRRGWQEFRTASRGIIRVYGPSPQLVWPLVRFLFRLLPPRVVRRIYAGNARNRVARLPICAF